MGKINSWKDYLKPQNLKLLRECNINYKHAVTYYKKRRWKEARKEYNNFIKKNTIDYDAFYELGLCCLNLGKMEVNSLREKKSKLNQTEQKEIQRKINGFFSECIENLSQAEKIEPENLVLKEELMNIKKFAENLKKKNRSVA